MMKNNIKKIMSLALLLLLAFTICKVDANAATSGSVLSVSASGTTTNVSVSGTTEANVVAVVVEIYDSSDNLVTMETFAVSSSNYSASLACSLENGSTYTAYVVNYDGTGSAKEATFIATAPAGASSDSGASNSSGSTDNSSDNSGQSSGDTSSTTSTTPASNTSTTKQDDAKKTASTKKSTGTGTGSQATQKNSLTKVEVANPSVVIEPTVLKMDSDSKKAWENVSKAVDKQLEKALEEAGVSKDAIDAIMKGEVSSDVLENPPQVIVEMGTSKVAPAEIFETIRGKNVDLVLEVADGVSWTVNGMNVADGSLSDINLDVTIGEAQIPESAMTNIPEGKETVLISLAHDGAFGFSATLTIDLKAENKGLYANLYYFNPDTQELELMTSSIIGEDGTAALDFVHASEYSIVVSEIDQVAAVASNESNESTEIETTDTGSASDVTNGAVEHVGLPLPVIALIVIIVLIAVGAVIYLLTKNKKK